MSDKMIEFLFLSAWGLCCFAFGWVMSYFYLKDKQGEQNEKL